MSRRRVPNHQPLDETIWEDYWSPVAAYQMPSDELWAVEDEADDWIELSDEIDFGDDEYDEDDFDPDAVDLSDEPPDPAGRAPLRSTRRSS